MKKMNRLNAALRLLTFVLLVSAADFAAGQESTSGKIESLSVNAVTHMELAVARLATAKYHTVAAALADGYVDTGYVPGEGFEYAKEQLIDCEFNPAEPEILLYAPVPHENRLRLVGVEYVVPLPCTATAPEGFTGDADVWREDSEGFGLWELNAWLWLENGNGIFADPPHPRVP